MCKYTVAVFLFVLMSNSVSADTKFADYYIANNSWQYSSWKEWAISPEVYEKNDPQNSYVVSYATAGGNVTVAVLTNELTCNGFSEHIRTHKILRYNGQSIRTSLQCFGKSRALIFPSTSAGNKFVIGEFTDKNSVEIEGFKKFSAKGFSNVLELVKEQAKRNVPL
ncbi:hypothetical protein ABMY36_22310 [Vibrio vulnificus]|uniref:hypothetical protein n=1 Tax=Vibrio vulnificus TaxID=672 RepID=UPI0021D8EC66|nr:hypothetical protein [Vibrio vulnificus]